ncbi:MAG: AAA family ATPase [Chloroflexi bacterium]|nr:AAA family ATPase [Chloroflexota bacterium]
MKLKKIIIDGFRCLQNLEISFEDNLTVVVGENDAGKSSLIDCLKVITQNKPVEIDDFNYNKNTITISVEIENFVFYKSYKLEEKTVKQQPMEAKPSESFLTLSKTNLEAEGIDIASPENDQKIRGLARIFGLTVRSNSSITNLHRSVLEKINEYLTDSSLKIENAQFPKFNNIQLDGKHFEDISSFFKEVFLKEKQSDIWQEKINEETTIEDFVRERIDSYSAEISEKMTERGIKDKVKLFLKNLTDIRIEPIYQAKNLNIDAKVKFLENGEEINLQMKGDGTKRRITMALLEFKKDEDKLEDDETTIYLLDEPDTHLHVKAQIELLETLQGFSGNGDQIILTTHSPFLINAVKPEQIRLLIANAKNSTEVRYLRQKDDIPTRVLQNMGIENIYLFFAKTLILTEGQTEEEFIKKFFARNTNRTLSSNLIRIINVDGIQNIAGFARGILEVHNPENIIVVCDNDASDEVRQLINTLNISERQKYMIGAREFEDAFSNEALFQCWHDYHKSHGRDCPANWSIENIRSLRQECLEKDLKFSSEIKKLGAGGKKMTKPIFGIALAEFIDRNHLPLELERLFSTLIS